VGGLSRSQDNVLTTAVEPTSPIYKPGQVPLVEALATGWLTDEDDEEESLDADYQASSKMACVPMRSHSTCV
jgi:hypothetical protein